MAVPCSDVGHAGTEIGGWVPQAAREMEVVRPGQRSCKCRAEDWVTGPLSALLTLTPAVWGQDLCEPRVASVKDLSPVLCCVRPPSLGTSASPLGVPDPRSVSAKFRAEKFTIFHAS